MLHQGIAGPIQSGRTHPPLPAPLCSQRPALMSCGYPPSPPPSAAFGLQWSGFLAPLPPALLLSSPALPASLHQAASSLHHPRSHLVMAAADGVRATAEGDGGEAWQCPCVSRRSQPICPSSPSSCDFSASYRGRL